MFDRSTSTNGDRILLDKQVGVRLLDLHRELPAVHRPCPGCWRVASAAAMCGVSLRRPGVDLVGDLGAAQRIVAAGALNRPLDRSVVQR